MCTQPTLRDVLLDTESVEVNRNIITIFYKLVKELSIIYIVYHFAAKYW